RRWIAEYGERHACLDRDAVHRPDLLLALAAAPAGGRAGRPTGEDAQRLRLEGVLEVGEDAGAAVGEERLGRAAERSVAVGEALDELRLEVRVEAEQVVTDQHLTIAVDAGPDSDGGNLQ